MSLVTIDIKYKSGSIGKLISTVKELFDIAYTLERSDNIKTFKVVFDYPVGPSHFGYNSTWEKWITPVKTNTEKLHVLLVSVFNIPANIILGDNWKKNKDDFCLGSVNKQDIYDAIVYLDLPSDKYLIKEYDLKSEFQDINT